MEIRKPLQEHFKSNSSLKTGERGTNTVMNAAAKGNMARATAS